MNNKRRVKSQNLENQRWRSLPVTKLVSEFSIAISLWSASVYKCMTSVHDFKHRRQDFCLCNAHQDVTIRPAALQTACVLYERHLNKTHHCFLFTNRQNTDLSDIQIKVCNNRVIWLPVMFSVNAAQEAHCCQAFLINTQCRLWSPVGSTTFTGLTVEVLVQYYPVCLKPRCVLEVWGTKLICLL